MRDERASGTLRDLPAGRITLAEFAGYFMDTSIHLRPKSRELYKGWLRVHILPVLGERRLSSIRKSDIKKFEADLIVAGKGTATVGGRDDHPHGGAHPDPLITAEAEVCASV